MVLKCGDDIMQNYTVDKDTFVMGSEPSPELTAEMVLKAISEIKTESELASLFAVVENKAWWIEDEEYDYDEGTAEYKQAREKTDLWFSLVDELHNRIFAILQSEGVEIPSKGQIMVLKPFMKRNGYINNKGWWIRNDDIRF